MRLFILASALFFFSCHAGKKQKSAAAVPQEKAPVTLILEVNTSLLVPDKNPNDALVCRLQNNTGEMFSLDLDTLFRFFSLYGQGASQKYPMFLDYRMPKGETPSLMYIDPGQSEVIFRSPLNQLFFNQLPFQPGGQGWMWQNTARQKAYYSPVHNYDKLQSSAVLWFELRWQGRNYTSNKVGFLVRSAR
jgi:hypothetical protein